MQENLEDLCKPALWRAVAAEFFGTLFLVLFGCGAMHNNGVGASIVQIALTFGLIYGSLVWCFNHVSGGHLNPAVTVAYTVCRRVSLIRGLLFILFQCVGAVAGAAVLLGLSASDTTLGVTAVASNIDAAQAFGIELLITFVLVFVILASTDEKRSDLGGSAPLSIGLSVVAGTLYAFSYTNASMNPARTFGPALITNNWANHWVYWVGPIVGAVVAALVYWYVFAASASFSRTKKFVLKHRKPAEKSKPANQDEHNSSKAGLIEIQMSETEGEAVVEVEKVEEEKKEEEAVEAAEGKTE